MLTGTVLQQCYSKVQSHDKVLKNDKNNHTHKLVFAVMVGLCHPTSHSKVGNTAVLLEISD